MIISYDKNPTLTTDQKLQSLINSLQLAFNEVMDENAAIKKELETLTKIINGDEILMRGDETWP